MIYLGVIGSFLMNLIPHLLVIKNKEFNLKHQPFSHLVHYKKSNLIFTLTVIITSIIRIIYFYFFINRFSLNNNYPIIFVIYLSLFSLLITGIFPVNKFEKIHVFFGYLILFSCIVFLAYFHFIYKLPGNINLLTVGKIIAFLLITGPLFLFNKFKEWGIGEAFFLFITFIWDMYILFGFLI